MQTQLKTFPLKAHVPTITPPLYPLQLFCPVTTSQLTLLRLLSSYAHQVFTLQDSTPSKDLQLISATGEIFTSEHITIDQVSYCVCYSAVYMILDIHYTAPTRVFPLALF